MKRIVPMIVSIAVLVLAFRTAAPAQEEKPKEKPQSDKRLNLIGGLSASTLYLSFLSVGMAGDAFSKDAYTAKEVSDICGEMRTILATNIKQVSDVAKGEPEESDRKALEEVVAIAEMVREYAQVLVDYSKEKDEKLGEKFQAQRQATWARLKKFLGIK